MTFALLAAGSGLLLLVLNVRRKRRIERMLFALSQQQQICGVSSSIPEALWALTASGEGDSVSRQLARSSSASIGELTREVDAAFEALSDEAKCRVLAAAEQSRRVRGTRAVWEDQANFLLSAAGAGLIDGVILGLGTEPELISSLIDPDQAADLTASLSSEFLASRILGRGSSLLMPDLHDWVAEHLQASLGDVSEAVIAPGVDVLGDSVGDAFSALADAHVPLATLALSANRARKALAAGIDGRRVAENLTADTALKGGGVALGAAIGTAIFPGVGTVLGGLVGSLLGGQGAQFAKERHLRAAQESGTKALTRIGGSISRSRWLAQGEALQQLIQLERKRWEELEALASAAPARRIRTPRLGHLAVWLAVETGRAALHQAEEDAEQWLSDLAESAGSDAAWFRGAMVMNRPDMINSLGVQQPLVDAARTAMSEINIERERLLHA